MLAIERSAARNLSTKFN